MDARQWTALQRAVENQNCILLLGPGASGSMVDGKFVPFTTQFSRKLAGKLDEAAVTYEKTDRDDLDYIAQLYLNDSRANPNDAAYEAKDFYTNNAKTPPPFLVELAKLPFRLVVNTTPDDLFMAAFQAAGKVGRIFDFYQFDRARTFVFDSPTFHKLDVDKPLVFNLFGHFSAPPSLVLTVNNQLDFIVSVNRDNPPLPPKLLEEFTGPKTFLFVGFDWREWHLQLLMKTLQLNKDSDILAPKVPGFEPNTMGQQIYKSLFKNFIFSDVKLEDFVTELSAKFAVPAPPDPAQTAAKKVFISYNPADDTLKDLIFNYLKTFERVGMAKFWHEEMLQPGEAREPKIASELAAADLILLLVSADYLSDDLIMENQFKPAIARLADGKTRVVPVILKPSQWDMFNELKQLPVILPNPGSEPGKPITTWPNQDEALQNIVENLKNLLK